MAHVPVKRLGEQQGGGRLKTTENYSEDEKYMVLAMELAKKGYGYTAPNPVVGAVIVKNGCIIGQGYQGLKRGRWMNATALPPLMPNDI